MAWGYASLLLVVGLAGACGSSSMMATTTCSQGKEACPCYGNLTCNAGLTCLSNLCVNPSAGNGGVTGTGGSTGSAGITGSAGMTGGGGTTGTAGTTGGAGSGGSAPVNLIKNGDFSQGKLYWDLTYQAGEVATSMYDQGQYCVYNDSTTLYLSFSLGYPPTPSDAFVIDPGATYTLSYRAMGTALTLPATVMVKIGHATSPYTELYSTTDSPNAAFQTFTHQISSATGDTGAGLVFNGTLDYYSYACFDDITLVKN